MLDGTVLVVNWRLRMCSGSPGQRSAQWLTKRSLKALMLAIKTRDLLDLVRCWGLGEGLKLRYMCTKKKKSRLWAQSKPQRRVLRGRTWTRRMTRRGALRLRCWSGAFPPPTPTVLIILVDISIISALSDLVNSPWPHWASYRGPNHVNSQCRVAIARQFAR
jgi:hypothetical protein